MCNMVPHSLYNSLRVGHKFKVDPSFVLSSMKETTADGLSSQVFHDYHELLGIMESGVSMPAEDTIDALLEKAHHDAKEDKKTLYFIH